MRVPGRWSGLIEGRSSVIRDAGLAVGVVVLAIIVLGTDWTGIEVSDGVWRDRVSLRRWAVFYALLVLLGAWAGRWLPTWSRRVAVLVPVLAWLTWQLQVGTLWPIALALYGTGLVVSWVVGCLLSGSLHVRRE